MTAAAGLLTRRATLIIRTSFQQSYQGCSTLLVELELIVKMEIWRQWSLLLIHVHKKINLNKGLLYDGQMRCSNPHVEIALRTFFCQFFTYHPTNIYTINVYVACEHSSLKNLDLVAIQSSDPRARKFNWQIFGKVWYFPPKSSEGYTKLKLKDKTLNLFVNDHKWVPSSCQVFFFLI